MSSALTLVALIIAIGSAAWAGLYALAEQSPGVSSPGQSAAGPDALPLHRSLYIARLALLIVAGFAASESIGWWNRPPVEGWGIALLSAAFLYMLADALPRSIGALAPDSATAAAALAQRTLLPFRPLLSLVSSIERMVQQLIRPAPEARSMGATHSEMLLGVFALGDTTVADVMTPRLDIAAVESHASHADALELLRTSEHARVPVYSETLDNVIGVLHAKDLVPSVGGLKPETAHWLDLVRPADFVPESKTLAAQLRDFQRGPSHLAIVVDEFGGTSGLMTLEDILEEIVGEIRDERDVDEKPAFERDGNHRFWVDGNVSLDELSSLLGTELVRDDVSTVGGLIYSELGRVPAAGEQLVIGEFRVVVEKVQKRRVLRVYFERLEPVPKLPVAEEVK